MTDQRPEKLMRASLKVKAMAFICLLVLAVSGSLSWYFLGQSQRSLMHELEKRALSLAKSLAYNSRYGMLTKDKVILQELVKGVLREDSVLSVLIINAQGTVLAQGNNTRQDDAQRVTDMAAQNTPALVSPVAIAAVHPQTLGKRTLYRAVAPVQTTQTSSSRRQQNLNTAILLLGSESRDAPHSKSQPIRLGSVHIVLSPAAVQANIRTTLQVSA